MTRLFSGNWESVSGKSRIYLATAPPPDIAVEVDVTNSTNIADYIPFEISEVWLIRGATLVTFALASEGYNQVESSQFPPKLIHQISISR